MTEEETQEFAELIVEKMTNFMLSFHPKEWEPNECEAYPVNILLPKGVVEKWREFVRDITEQYKNEGRETADDILTAVLGNFIFMGLKATALEQIEKQKKEENED